MHVGSGDKTSAWQCTMHVPSSSFPTVHSHSPDHSRRVRCRRSGQWAKGQGTVCNIAQDWFTRLKFLGAETTVFLRNKWYQFTNVKPDDSDDEKKKKWCPTGKDVKQNVDQVLERGTQPLTMAVSTHRVKTDEDEEQRKQTARHNNVLTQPPPRPSLTSTFRPTSFGLLVLIHLLLAVVLVVS